MYQGIEHNFSQMGIYEQSSQKKLPPAVAPKPKKHSAAPAPYRPGGSTYRPFNTKDDDFPPPPPPQLNYAEDIQVFPPPPPPLEEDDMLPPPPQIPQPQSSQGYGRQSPAEQISLNYRTASPGYSTGTSPGGYSSQTSPGYSGQTSPGYSSQVSPRYDRQSPEPARTASPSGYRSYSPTVRVYDSGNEYASTSMYQRDKQSYPLRSASPMGRSPPYNPSSNQYANLPAYSSSPPSQESSHHARPVSTSSEGFTPRYEMERPVPGPQVPSSPTMSGRDPASPGLDKGSSNKEAELDALTSLLMQNMESSKEPDYFGMCTRCNKKVMGENNGCTTNDQVYHINCFSCLTCGTLLQGKSFYSMDSKPYCEACYINTLERCSVCSKPITDRLLRATGKPYHPACFTCVVCGISLDGIPFTVDATNQIHCIEDFHKKFAPRCCVCQNPIMPETGQDETVRVVTLDRSFHVQCYRCEDCGLQLSSEADGRGCYPLDEHILCKHCNAKRIQAMTTKMTTEL